MRATLIVIAAAVLPLVWGYLVHSVMARIWPEASREEEPNGNGNGPSSGLPVPIDYQI